MEEGVFLMNKKAQIQSKLGIIIISLIIFVLLLIFLLKLHAYFSKSDREICRSSVLAQSLLMQAPTPGSEKIVTPKCKTYKVVFFNDHVEIDDKTIEVYDSRKKDFVKKFNGLTDEIVNQVIAEELRWCWYQFLEGKKSLFNIKTLFAGGSVLSCYLCDEITFDSSVGEKEFKSFYNYTKHKTMPNSQMTYYEYYAEESRLYSPFYDRDPDKNAWEEYVQGRGNEVFISEKCKELEVSLFEPRKPITKNIIFDTSKKYAVVFIKEGITSKVREIIGTKEEGCSPETYFSYILSFDDLSEQCKSLRRGSMK